MEATNHYWLLNEKGRTMKRIARSLLLLTFLLTLVCLAAGPGRADVAAVPTLDFGYYNVDTIRYGFYVDEVTSRTNLIYIGGADAGVSDTPPAELYANLRLLIARAAQANLQIMLDIELGGPLTVGAVLQAAQPHWERVKYVILADELSDPHPGCAPGHCYTVAEINNEIDLLRRRMRNLGLDDSKPIGVTLTPDVALDDEIVFANWDFINVEAYSQPCSCSACGAATAAPEIQAVAGRLAQAEARIPASTFLTVVMQGYDRNGAFTNLPVLTALNRATYFDMVKGDPRVRAIVVFSYGRRGNQCGTGAGFGFGTRGHAELIAAHQEIWDDITRPVAEMLLVDKTGNGTGRVTSYPAGIDCGVDCSEEYPPAATVELRADPDSSSTFEGWTGEGCEAAGTGPCAVRMDRPRRVTARFALRSFTVTLTKGGTGQGTVTSTPPGLDCGPGCSQVSASFLWGTTLRLGMRPEPGSTFVSWGGACQGTQSTCDVTVRGPAAIAASFDPPIPSAALQYYPLVEPCRAVDTRTTASPLLHGVPRAIQVTGPCVPGVAQAVAAVVTAVRPSGAGNIQMNGGPLTLTSVATFPAAGGAWASSAVTSLSNAGQVTAMASVAGEGSTHLVIDVTGYFGAPDVGGQNYTPASSPWRLADINLLAGVQSIFPVGNGISALAVSVAAIDTPAAGHLAVFPAGGTSGGTSTLNYAVGSRLYNGTIVRLGASPKGEVAALSTQAHRFLIDVNGVFHAPTSDSLQYHPIAPCRVLDTRISGGRFTAGERRAIQVRGMCGAIPDNARAVAANFAVVRPDTVGHLQFWATGSAFPIGGQLLYQSSWVIGSGAVLPLSSATTAANDLSVYSVAATHLVVDITGYFAPTP